MTPSTAQIDDRRAVLQVLDDWWRAVNDGDVETVIDLTSDDFELIPPGEEAVAGAEAHDVLRGFFDEFRVTVPPFTGEEIVVSGDLAYQRLSYEWVLTPKVEGEVIREHGHGIHLLRRQGDGGWKVTMDIFNTVTTQ